MNAFKINLFLIPCILVACGGDEHETTSSNSIPLSRFDTRVEVNEYRDNTYITVSLNDTQYRTTDTNDYDFISEQRSEEYFPAIELSNGEYLEIDYDGQIETFESGESSPFYFQPTPSEDGEIDFRVTLYRNGGRTIDIVSTLSPRNFTVEGLNPSEISYDAQYPLRWSNGREEQDIELSFSRLNCERAHRGSKRLVVDDSGVYNFYLRDIFDDPNFPPSPQDCLLELDFSRTQTLDINPSLSSSSTSNYVIFKELELNIVHPEEE